jgi:hypothetical protein
LGGAKYRRHIYVDNGAPVLLVAHIDTVHTPRYVSPADGAGFDDRLGVCAAHQLVQAHPQWYDLLLTDYEEALATTAQYFRPSHEYNWVVELDREGEDYVDYGLASEDFHDAMVQHGFRQGIGSYTDICDMDYICASKVNIGIGTYRGHSPHSGFDPDALRRQIRRLLSLTADCAQTAYPMEWASECPLCGDTLDLSGSCPTCGYFLDSGSPRQYNGVL